jgi:hypothetical protein
MKVIPATGQIRYGVAHIKPASLLACVLVLVVLTAALALVVRGAPAFAASGPPQFEPTLYEEFEGSSGGKLAPTVFATRAHIAVEIETGSLEVKWHGEYATSEALLNEHKGTPAGGGTTEPNGPNGEDVFAYDEVIALGTNEHADTYYDNSQQILRHLAPSTTYYARFHAENSNHESAEKTFKFVTPGIAKPELIFPSAIRPKSEDGVIEEGSGLTGGAASPTTAGFETKVEANGAQTEYHFEYALPEAGHAPVASSSSWAPFSAGEVSGTVAATPFATAEGFAIPKAEVSGLAPETTYYARVRAGNAYGSAEEVVPFMTFPARPNVSKVTVSGVTGASAHLSGEVEPRGLETDWHFEYAPSVIGPWSPVSGAAGVISQAEAEALEKAKASSEPYWRTVEGDLAGLSPGKTYYVRLFAESKAGEGEHCYDQGHQLFCEPNPVTSFQTVGGAPLVSTFAVHGLHGEALRLIGSVNPEGSDTHYRFEYASQKQFEAPGGEGGFAKAASTAEVDAGSGIGVVFVGADLPVLMPGETYRFRLVASSAAAEPSLVVDGGEQSLTVPVPPAPSGAGGSGSCPNEALRTGASALLPDCRAFEQLTPVDKEGTQEVFAYGAEVSKEGAVVGEDGDHLEYGAPAVKWGAGPTAGQSPYFFSRSETGWQRVAATTQPEGGVALYHPQVFGPDLEEFGFESESATSPTGIGVCRWSSSGSVLPVARM